MLLIKLAIRNIFRQKRRTSLTALTMIGGFVLFSLSLGIADGSYADIIDRFIKDHTGHLQIHKKGYLDRPNLYETIPNSSSVLQVLDSQPQVLSYSPRVRSAALAFHKNKTSGLELIGVYPKKEAATTEIRKKVKLGTYFSGGPNEVLVGEGIAEILKLEIGSELVLISQGADGSIANDVFNVAGILGGAADSAYRMAGVFPMDSLQDYLSLNGRYHEVAVLLPASSNARNIAKQIQQKLSDETDVQPWQTVESEFYRAMELDKKGNYVSLGIITLIVAIGVLNTVLMTLLERTREFGVLRALGTRSWMLVGIVVLENFFLSALSMAIASVLAFFAHLYFVKIGIPLPEPITFAGFEFSVISSRFSISAFLVPALVTIGAAVFISIPPSIRAARIPIVDALRST